MHREAFLGMFRFGEVTLAVPFVDPAFSLGRDLPGA